VAGGSSDAKKIKRGAGRIPSRRIVRHEFERIYPRGKSLGYSPRRGIDEPRHGECVGAIGGLAIRVDLVAGSQLDMMKAVPTGSGVVALMERRQPCAM